VANRSTEAKRRSFQVVWVSLFLGFVVLGPGFAREASAQAKIPADRTDSDNEIQRLAAEVRKGAMPYGYAALRQLWAEWDRRDPTEVERALASVATDTQLPPPLRAYAGLLEAYARRRLGDLEGSKTAIARLGFINRWLITGPFDNEGKSGFSKAFAFEQEINEPISLVRTYEGKEHPATSRFAPDVFPYGWVDLGAMVRPAEKICVYATTFVRQRPDASASSTKEREFSLWFGTAGASKVFFDGNLVFQDAHYRDLDSERFGVTLTLRTGWHRLTLKVCSDDNPPMLTMRLADKTGAPDPSLEFDADIAHSRESSAARFRKDGEASTKKMQDTHASVAGPIRSFDRLIASGSPAALEAYARYLSLTHSDDPADHQARDLARRAAEKAPTAPRALLAGELAESRYQQNAWIERAEALVSLTKPSSAMTNKERIDTLLARASHVRRGPNWRDAMVFYDRALELDPDNLQATLARVELYVEAGLQETALTKLQDALKKHPQSVALLRTTTAALRDLGRIAEASELTRRYSQLRFDDTTVHSDAIDLAVIQRNTDEALRWIDRILQTAPDSLRAHSTAARAYVRLGDRPEAVAALKKALEIAPDDIATLRALADVYALGGQTEASRQLLQRVLELRPQEKDVRDYLTHTQAEQNRADESYAKPSAEFLKLRDEPSQGRNRRTLVNMQVTTVFPNGLASRFHQVVFQPLTDAAAAEAREYSFSFEADSEIVQLRGAKVYKRDGRTLEAVESGESRTDNPATAMYSSARAFYVHFPRLDPGDVIELQYRVEDVTPQNAFADYFGEVVYMQSSEPIAHSEYVLITPKSRKFYFNKPELPGLTATTKETKDSDIRRFVASRVAPLEIEPRMPPMPEALAHVHVSTYKNWDEMGRWYWGLVRDQFVPDDEVRKRASEITKGISDDKAKVRAVYNYVVQQTRYVALEFGIHGFKPYRCSQIFARGFGDCKDKATLIVTMLKELGIDATIVIVRTGLRGDFESEPASLAPFDHAIAYVPSMNLYLDGTAEWTGASELPPMDRGALALLINEGNPRLVHLPEPSAAESVTRKRVEATVRADGSALIDLEINATGAFASSWRSRYQAKSTQQLRLQEELSSDLPAFEISSVTTNDLNNLDENVTLRARGRAPTFAKKTSEAWSVPMGAREHLVSTWAPSSIRRRDIRINAMTTDEKETAVTLPPGARILSSPKQAAIQSPFGSVTVDVRIEGANVFVKTAVAITRSRIRADEYASFRSFCEQADKSLGQFLTFTVGQ